MRAEFGEPFESLAGPQNVAAMIVSARLESQSIRHGKWVSLNFDSCVTILHLQENSN